MRGGQRGKVRRLVAQTRSGKLPPNNGASKLKNLYTLNEN